jgi:hypothetical protein
VVTWLRMGEPKSIQFSVLTSRYVNVRQRVTSPLKLHSLECEWGSRIKVHYLHKVAKDVTCCPMAVVVSHAKVKEAKLRGSNPNWQNSLIRRWPNARTRDPSPRFFVAGVFCGQAAVLCALSRPRNTRPSVGGAEGGRPMSSANDERPSCYARVIVASKPPHTTL